LPTLDMQLPSSKEVLPQLPLLFVFCMDLQRATNTTNLVENRPWQ